MKLARADAEDFLYREARLLDGRDYAAWLELFTDDAIYWLPMDENADPELESSVLYDDTETLRMRVHQLMHKPHFAQVPPSRTVHAVSNVEVAPAERDDEALVRCTVTVTELREGDFLQRGLGEQRLFAGHCEYRLRQHEGGLAIALKKLILISRDLPIENLSFLL